VKALELRREIEKILEAENLRHLMELMPWGPSEDDFDPDEEFDPREIAVMMIGTTKLIDDLSKVEGREHLPPRLIQVINDFLTFAESRLERIKDDPVTKAVLV
jgi:hypothetical protein